MMFGSKFSLIMSSFKILKSWEARKLEGWEAE
jgi:hypothetical protein